MSTRLGWAALVALPILPACSGMPGTLPPGRARPTIAELVAAADSALEPLHRRGYLNGAVVLGRSGEPLYARGFGAANAAAGAPFTPETPSDGASIAKTLTAAAVLMLEDEGRLGLDDPVRRHLPEYPHSGTRIIHLITHSAGLPEAEYDFFEGLLPEGTVRTTELHLKALREQNVPPDFEPGTRFRYSSLGFDIAALVVERVSGKRYEDFLRERILGPLGMDSTFVRPARFADWPGTRTMSYRRIDDTLLVRDVFDDEGFYGGSNVYLSALDLYRWGRSFYRNSLLGARVLRRGMTAPSLRDAATGIGGPSRINLLGWYHPGRERRYHYPGMLEGFYSSLYHDDDRGYTIALMSNTGMPQWVRPLVMRTLVDILDGRRPPPIGERRFTRLDSVALESVPGSYQVEGIGNVEIIRRRDHAMVRVDHGLRYPAYPLGDGQLYVPGLDAWIGFPADTSPGFDRLTWLSIFQVGDGLRK